MNKKQFVNLAYELLRYALYGAPAGNRASLLLHDGRFIKRLRKVNKLSKMTGLPVATINQLFAKDEILAKRHLHAAYVILLYVSAVGNKMERFDLNNFVSEKVSKDTNIMLSDLKEFRRHIKRTIKAHSFQVFVVRPIEESLIE